MAFFDYAGELLLGLVAITLLPYMLLGLAIPYAVLRLRETREGRADPQLGLKVALNFFFSLSLLIILLGLTILVVDVLLQTDFPRRGGGIRDEFPNSAQRTGFAIVCSGLLFILLHFICLVTLTTEPFSSPVRRTFLGWRFAIHGLVVMTAVTGMMIVLFQRREVPVDEVRRFLIGTLIVWAPSWFLHFVLFRVSSASPAWRPEREVEPYDDDLPPYRHR